MKRKVQPFVEKSAYSTPPDYLSETEIAAWGELYPLCAELIEPKTVPPFVCLVRAWARMRTDAEVSGTLLTQIRLLMDMFGLVPTPPPVQLQRWDGAA